MKKKKLFYGVVATSVLALGIGVSSFPDENKVVRQYWDVGRNVARLEQAGGVQGESAPVREYEEARLRALNELREEKARLRSLPEYTDYNSKSFKGTCFTIGGLALLVGSLIVSAASESKKGRL